MEQFLEQSAQAEDNFYRMEEQRLQAEDRRREAEHGRELQMLQMLAQMFSGISSSGRPSPSSSAPSKPSPPARPPVISSTPPSQAVRGPSGHLRTDCFGQPMSTDPQALGVRSGAVYEEKIKGSAGVM